MGYSKIYKVYIDQIFRISGTKCRIYGIIIFVKWNIDRGNIVKSMGLIYGC